MIRRVNLGPAPRAAFAVTIFWPDSAPGPDRYSYTDTLSVPKLEVTEHRLITYRLLDFGDVIVLDEIQGLTGRPLTGILAILFRLIGEGHLVETRMAISSDGLQVLRGRATKGPFSVSTTATVFPNGQAIKGLPEGRRDLAGVEGRLEEPFEVEYAPFP